MAPVSDDTAVLRALEAIPLALPAGLDVQWLGVSGYRITYEGVSLFVDPYVSRVPLRALLLGRVAMPDEALIDRYISAPGPVAGVLVGHTHFDHAVDADLAEVHQARPGDMAAELDQFLLAGRRIGFIFWRPRERIQIASHIQDDDLAAVCL